MAGILLSPEGRPADPSKTFLVDGYGNELRADQKDFALPAYLTVTSIIQGASKTFLAQGFDEALKNSYENARAMYRDCRIMGWLEERIESVANLKWHLEIEDEKSPVQKCVRDGLTKAMKRIPHFKRILRALLKWGLWSGRGVSHLCWDWYDMELPVVPEKNMFEEMQRQIDKSKGIGITNGQMNDQQNGRHPPGQEEEDDESSDIDFPTEKRPVLVPFKNRPVNGDKINYLWGYSQGGAPPGTPIVRVHGASGFDLPGAEIIYDNIGPNIALAGEWRERFVIHTYDPDDADYFAPEMAGGIYGVGIRSRIYWVNWIRMRYAEWIQDLYDRVGLGFVCIKYDMASNTAKKLAEDAAKKWNRRSVLAIPVTADQLQRAGSIEVVEVPTTGAVVVQELVKYLDKQLERYILRQTVSGGGGSQGDGMRGTVGPAEMAAKTEVQRIKADAEELEETITGSYEEPGIVNTMMRWTYPGLWDDQKKQFAFPVRFVFEVEENSSKEKLQTVTMAVGMGVKFKSDEVRSLTGLTKPDPNDETVGGDKPSAHGGGEGGHRGDAASTKAAQEWIAEGRARGKIQELADRYGITRQAIGEAAKKLEGGRENVEKYSEN